MRQFNQELKSYAKTGLRTAADWVTLGREVQEGGKSRVDVTYHGERVGLFTRDQTHLKVPPSGQ